MIRTFLLMAACICLSCRPTCHAGGLSAPTKITACQQEEIEAKKADGARRLQLLFEQPFSGGGGGGPLPAQGASTELIPLWHEEPYANADDKASKPQIPHPR